jgi:hypothetical protein
MYGPGMAWLWMPVMWMWWLGVLAAIGWGAVYLFRRDSGAARPDSAEQILRRRLASPQARLTPTPSSRPARCSRHGNQPTTEHPVPGANLNHTAGRRVHRLPLCDRLSSSLAGAVRESRAEARLAARVSGGRSRFGEAGWFCHRPRATASLES